MAKRLKDNRAPKVGKPHKPSVAVTGGIDRRAPTGASLFVCGLLLVAVALVFGQTIRHDFINYDDDQYVTKSQVARGMSAQSVGWALTTTHGSMWAPVTYLSHMLDVELYGLNPWGHHLTNVLLHAANAVLVFLVLWRMTGSLWPSAFAAALFAIHPLRAESVAWIAERKGLLGALFFFATLGAYIAFVRRPFGLARYVAVLFLLAVGLMAKPILVTLPALLLLLDYWPLGRLRLGWRLLWEKLPMFAIVAISAASAPLTQGSAVQTLQDAPMTLRLANVPVAYAVYVGQFFWPIQMYLPYLYPENGYPAREVIGTLSIVVAISVAALMLVRRCPYLFVGWFWYLGTLAPTIGLVPVGIQVRADRYTYVPQIGLCLAVAWGAAQLFHRWSHRRLMCGASSAIALSSLMGIAWQQTTYWNNSTTLWNHTLAFAPNNSVAQTALGASLLGEHRIAEAVVALERAVEIQPGDALPHTNLGSALAEQGRADEAIKQYQIAIGIDAADKIAHIGLGRLLAARGETEKAADQYRAVLAADRTHAEANNLLGNILARGGQLDAAISHFQAAVKSDPEYVEAQINLGMALAQSGKMAEAVGHWREAVRLKPDFIEGANQLAWVLATHRDSAVRNGPEAVRLAERTARLSGGERPDVLDTLAAAYAETGQFADAVRTARRAAEAAKQQNRPDLAARIEARVRLYESGTPFQENK